MAAAPPPSQPTSAAPAALLMRACSSCGAGLALGGGVQQVRCAFCRVVQAVSSEQAPDAALAEQAAAAEREGIEALWRAFVRVHGIDKGKWLVAGAFGAFIIPALIVLELANPLDIRSQTAKHTLLLFGAAVTITATVGYVAMRRRQAPERGRRDLERFLATRRPNSERGACPNCGAPIEVPVGSASMTCCFCHTPLAASCGMLIRWVQQAEQRQAQWEGLARQISQRATRRRSAVGVLAIWLVLSAPAFLLGGAFFTKLLGRAWDRLVPIAADEAVGERVKLPGIFRNGSIREVYGKLALVVMDNPKDEEGPRFWVDVTKDPFAQKRVEPAKDPTDPNRWKVGDLLRVAKPDGPVKRYRFHKVSEIYGNMVLLSDFWARDAECTQCPRWADPDSPHCQDGRWR